MKIEEMIEKLRYKANNIKAKIEPEFFWEVAEVLETQVEKETKVFNDGYFDLFECPICKEIYDACDDDYSYCSKCGQKIKVVVRNEADE